MVAVLEVLVRRTWIAPPHCLLCCLARLSPNLSTMSLSLRHLLRRRSAGKVSPLLFARLHRHRGSLRPNLVLLILWVHRFLDLR